MTVRRGLALAGLTLALALVAGRLLAGAYANWAWYDALGARSLWEARLAALTALRTGLFAIAFLFAWVNLLAMRRSIVSLVLPRRLGNLEIGEAVPGRRLTAIAALCSVLIAAIVALPESDWVGLLRAAWARPLGESDPYVGRDLSFWLGWLPFERSMHEWFVTLAVVVGLAILVLYGMTPSVRFEQGRVHISTWVRRHFAVYTMVLLLIVAWGYRIDAFDLLLHGSGPREAFVAFDHRVMYPYLIALSVGTAAVALLVAWTGWLGHQRATVGALLVVLVAGPIGRLVLPLLDQRAASDRERNALDAPYHRVRELYTRRAYAVDNIARGAMADSVRVAPAALAGVASSWDPTALVRASADEPGVEAVAGGFIWRVAGDGALRASVVLGSATSDAARTALAMLSLDPSDADERGAPWPAPEGMAPSISPLAVGLGLPAVLAIDDTLGRVAAPAFPPGWRRVALAWSVQNMKLAVNDAETPRTRLLMRRDVRERVQAIVPFFAIGATPQAIVVRDSLFWTLELFNASDSYPLTEPLQWSGELRRTAVAAGVALVNAHSGRVRVLLPSRPDKLTRWWRDRLPELFSAHREVAPEILAALPAPVDRAVIQGAALAHTGFRSDTLAARPLFAADDADADFAGEGPLPFISGAQGHPLAWAAPTVDAIDRLRGVLVAVGGESPRTVLVEQPDSGRWAAVLDRLQRTADSARISRSLRHPRRGRVQLIPTTDGLVVIQSFYDWAPEREPSLAGVVVLQAGQARVGTSLLAALGAPARAVVPDGALRLRLRGLYRELQEAQRRGDWAAFGRAMDALGQLAGRP